MRAEERVRREAIECELVFEASEGGIECERGFEGEKTLEVLDSVTAQGKRHRCLIALCYVRIRSRTEGGKKERNERKNYIQCCVARGLGITA